MLQNGLFIDLNEMFTIHTIDIHVFIVFTRSHMGHLANTAELLTIE